MLKDERTQKNRTGGKFSPEPQLRLRVFSRIFLQQGCPIRLHTPKAAQPFVFSSALRPHWIISTIWQVTNLPQSRRYTKVLCCKCKRCRFNDSSTWGGQTSDTHNVRDLTFVQGGVLEKKRQTRSASSAPATAPGGAGSGWGTHCRVPLREGWGLAVSHCISELLKY